jgi:hypothetical protein
MKLGSIGRLPMLPNSLPPMRDASIGGLMQATYPLLGSI